MRPGVVLLAWCDDASDPQHAISQEALELLTQERDAQGRQLQASEGKEEEGGLKGQRRWAHAPPCVLALAVKTVALRPHSSQGHDSCC